MAERELEINLTDSTDVRAESRSDRKARLASVLERGIIADRLMVELPEGVHGEWVPNVTQEILRMQALGFQIDETYATKRALHSDGTGKAIIGDTIFMTCSAETKQIIDEIAREKFEKIHGNPKNRGRSQAEESEYTEANRRLGIPVLNESRVNVADGNDIARVAKDAIESPLDKNVVEPS